MKWRSILAGVSALLVAVVVVRNAVVVQSAKTNPQLAARVWPSHPSSQLWLGLTQIGLSARARKPVAPATFALIRDAAMKAPLAPEPFLVRGVEGQMAGNSRLATAAFVGARLGFAPVVRDDHASYVKSWLRALRNDDRAIFTAAAAAQKACDYLVVSGVDPADVEIPADVVGDPAEEIPA